jgi:hypothetical protein
MAIRTSAAALVALTLGLGASQLGAHELIGASASLGQGMVDSYAEIGADGVPREIGIVFSKGALDGLPPEPNRTSRCFDLDGNGRINDTGECDGDLENNLPFPAEVTGRADIPFEFAMVNWNPHGHPPEVWALPHFDIHFYSIPKTAVEAIRIGPCGIFIDCEDFARAVKPVPAKYVATDHASVQAAVGRMGDHLIDTKAPEFGDPPAPFTHTWIFGRGSGCLLRNQATASPGTGGILPNPLLHPLGARGRACEGLHGRVRAAARRLEHFRSGWNHPLTRKMRPANA